MKHSSFAAHRILYVAVVLSVIDMTGAYCDGQCLEQSNIECEDGYTMQAQDSSCSSTGTGCGWCLCETCYQCCKAQTYDDAPHSHSPHGHSPHTHRPHNHSPHHHSPHRHSPHRHSPHTHDPASAHAHTPHSHSPHTHGPAAAQDPVDTHVQTHVHNPNAPSQPYDDDDQGSDPDYNDPDYTDPDYTDPDYTDPDYTDPDYSEPYETPREGRAASGVIGYVFGALGLCICTVFTSIQAWCVRNKRRDAAAVRAALVAHEAKAIEEKARAEAEEKADAEANAPETTGLETTSEMGDESKAGAVAKNSKNPQVEMAIAI